LEPELVAHHYSAAGQSEPAIDYWRRAGQRAIKQSANEEAIDHLNKGLDLLESLPETPERVEQKLALHISLGVPLLMTKGYASLEIERVYAGAWQLCRQIGETEQLASALFGLWVFYLVRADYQMASQLGEDLMALAERLQDAALLREAHQVQGINMFYLGELALASEHLEQAVDRYNPEKTGGRASYSGADQGVASLSHAALALWLRGYPNQALEKAKAALDLAKRLGQPFSLAFGLSMAALLHQYRREGTLALERAEAAIACSKEQGFELLLGFSTIFKGWALAEQGQVEPGVIIIRQGLDAFQGTGAELGRLHFLALLADVYGQAGQIEAGLSVLAEAITATHQKGERFYEAELFRLKGVLTWKTQAETNGKNSKDEASGESPESCFRQAIEVAQQQAAKSLELRASINLSQLWHEQGRQPEARQLLSNIYAWFSEGFDTADLQEAKTLLEKWS
jgi:predicted ATPase